MPEIRSTRRTSNEEEKQQRLHDILDAALAVCLETSYGELTVAQVAKRAGIAKGTVYLYFASKDALGLALERRLLTAWSADLHGTLQGASWGIAPRELAELIGGTVRRHEHGFRVLVGLFGSLEPTADPAALAEVKSLLLTRLAESGAVVEQHAPYLLAGQGFRLLFLVYALATGLHQTTEHTPHLGQPLLSRRDLRPLQRALSALVTEAVRAHLEGLRAIRTGEAMTTVPTPHNVSPEVVVSRLREREPPPRNGRWWQLP